MNSLRLGTKQREWPRHSQGVANINLEKYKPRATPATSLKEGGLCGLCENEVVWVKQEIFRSRKAQAEPMLGALASIATPRGRKRSVLLMPHSGGAAGQYHSRIGDGEADLVGG